ncbi:arginine/serine-rich coiled-coil protein 2 isoform X3 [Bactrocera neohumeralis]|uniref:arginine/serine-rich coiled-coil protein 2 isoform X3 n=1 Tax=Bactrocera neohumeralis TaxID=98809 RepID=UPI0021661A31|nr:arginine/serine-rich coiled-coil protein 2 isoform X3 [Bactrocera neohumeralis]
MEGLVNYSSEDEQEETMDHITDTQRQSSKRPTSSTYHSRDNKRDNRDNRRESRDNVRDHREERESRDARYSKDHNRYDYKNDRTRTRDFQSDHKRERDNFDNRRPPRDDDRNRPSSSYKNNRYGGSFRDDRHRHDSSNTNAGPSSLRQQHHNRSVDQRHTEHYDHSGSRYRRRSNSRSPSPSTGQRHYHSKRSGHDEKSYSRHRSRSRSITPGRSDSRDREGFALEKARLSAQAMERKIHPDSHTSQEKDAQSLHPSTRTEALLALPLNETAPKQPNVIAVAPVPSTSSNNGGEPAVIQLPSYYNPNVINPNKYAEQVQKRKLLWGAKKAEDTAAKWGNAQFSQDTDGKVASKFMRLMGIKGSGPSKSEEVVEQKVVPSVAPDVKSREVMFSNMEQQYEVARQATHTMRGVGLGFSSQARPF